MPHMRGSKKKKQNNENENENENEGVHMLFKDRWSAVVVLFFFFSTRSVMHSTPMGRTSFTK